MIKLDKEKWISEQISKDIKQWDKGSIITISSGTGSGKSYFIKNSLYNYANFYNKKILLLVHRNNCMWQFKSELAGKEDIINITTYQTVDMIENSNSGSFDFSKYDYIVCDEFHYFMSDSEMNKMTDISFNRILEQNNITRIFMSATGNHVSEYMYQAAGIIPISYTQNSDYSFIDNLYFYEDDETEAAIIQKVIDKNEKAIVFINNLKRLEELYLRYKNDSMFNCSDTNKQHKYVDNDKVTDMLVNSRFKDNILFTTTVMDTGVSIVDRDVKTIICNNIVDINILVQVIGRKRIIDKDDKVDIYIKNLNGRMISGHLSVIRRDLERVDYFWEHGEQQYTIEYGRQKDNKDIIYQTIKNGKMVSMVNNMAYFHTIHRKEMLESMMSIGYKNYISNFFDKGYMEVEEMVEKLEVEEYLGSIVGEVMLELSDREELIERINIRSNGRQLKSLNSLNSALKEMDSNYTIDSFSTSRIIDGKKVNYRSAWRVLKLIGK